VLFAYPVNPLIEAAAKIDIRTVIVRQERIGLGPADAYSRMFSSDKIGVFCMQHITKWAEPLTMGKAITEVLRRAFFQLRNGRPGPVMLEVPLDVFNEDVPDTWEHVPAFSAKTGPAPSDIEVAAKVLAEAENPVIYAGQGVHYAKAWEELKTLAETWNIPVTTSIEGKSAFPEDHPLSLGSGGRARPRPPSTPTGCCGS